MGGSDNCTWKQGCPRVFVDPSGKLVVQGYDFEGLHDGSQPFSIMAPRAFRLSTRVEVSPIALID